MTIWSIWAACAGDAARDFTLGEGAIVNDAAAVVHAGQLTRADSATEYRIHVGPVPEEWK